MKSKFKKIKEKFLIDSSYRISILKFTVIGGLITGLLLSIKLWIGNRIFPKAPVFDSFSAVPPTVETILFILLIGLLGVSLIRKKPGKLILGAVIVMVVLALFDQMRWQPWFYQYLIILVVLTAYFLQSKNNNKNSKTLNTIRLMVAGIYFFSGLQKLNMEFINNLFPWIIDPVITLLPSYMHAFIYDLGIAVPFIEMGIGIGLLTKKFRSHAVGLTILTTIFVLFTLGPLGRNWNSVIWPWNIVMALAVIVLFWRAGNLTFKDFFRVKNFLVHKVILVLFIIMPLFSFTGLWDSYLSSSLYSGNTKNAQVLIDSSVENNMPSTLQKYISQSEENTYWLDISSWSFDELNVPIYPETRVYKKIGQNLCQYANNGDGMTLIIEEKSILSSDKQKSEYRCSD